MMPDPLETLLQADDADVEARWRRLTAWLRERFDREPTIETTLFLIGIQARGMGFEPKLSKARKQALIMEGAYAVFEALGLYERVGMDADGFWIRERTRPLPALSVEGQEKLLRLAILRYFEETLPASERV
ncbi:hypothetical protein [Rhodocaloribacter sp.]